MGALNRDIPQLDVRNIVVALKRRWWIVPLCMVIGAGVMGCATALFLARGGMRVVLLDRGEICREASGVNAGTLTMQMTRAALIPYALHAHEMWMNMPAWCAGGDVLATACPGLSVAFTDAEAAMLEERARIRREAGANRRSRRPQKALRSIRPVFSHSLISSDVIKNPESVKNTDTPKKPPGNQPRPEWKMITKMTATPRRPSNPR